LITINDTIQFQEKSYMLYFTTSLKLRYQKYIIKWRHKHLYPS